MIIFVETHKTITDMRRIVTVAAALLCSLFAAGLSAQTTLVKKSKAKAAIVLVDEDARTKQAAELLQDFVKRISGAELPVTDQTESKHNVFIGGQAAEDVGDIRRVFHVRFF